MLRTAQLLPPPWLLTLGFDPARFQTEPPACYRASWQLPGPDSHRLATTSFPSGHDRWTITSSALGARNFGLSHSSDHKIRRAEFGGVDFVHAPILMPCRHGNCGPRRRLSYPDIAVRGIG